MDDKLQKIQNALERIEHVLKVRWVIFAAIWLALLMCAAAEFLHWQALKRVQELTLLADSRSIKNEAAIDAALKQQIAYQQQLAQYWDYLSSKNPKVKVPRVIVRPPNSPIPLSTPTETPPVAILTDAQLTRNNAVAKEKASSKTSTRKTSKKPSPTPGPLERFFKPRSTR